MEARHDMILVVETVDPLKQLSSRLSESLLPFHEQAAVQHAQYILVERTTKAMRPFQMIRAADGIRAIIAEGVVFSSGSTAVSWRATGNIQQVESFEAFKAQVSQQWPGTQFVFDNGDIVE